jgi:hypothetical protein
VPGFEKLFFAFEQLSLDFEQNFVERGKLGPTFRLAIALHRPPSAQRRARGHYKRHDNHHQATSKDELAPHSDVDARVRRHIDGPNA